MKWNRILPRSIRRRLPLSYAAVALLTALVLGVVLLSALRLYYREREAEYLARSASTIEAALAESLSAGAADESVQNQVIDLAFLTETRIQFVDPGGSVIADSGTLDLNRLRLLILQERLFGIATRLGDMSPQGTQPDPDSSESAAPSETPPSVRSIPEMPPGTRLPLVIPRLENLYAFRPGPSDPSFQSDLSTTLMVHHDETGEILGHIIVSGGPGYSQGILSGVALAWALAGAVAVLLAALVGWLASRQITRPLSGLTGVTATMAEGDLAARADVSRPDEFGALAVSFNEMAERLQAFVGTLQRFVADAAHELNTPLTALRNSLDLALEEEDREAQTALIMDGRFQVERLEELAHGLLELSRLESGDVGPEHQPVDLVKLALKMSEFYASQAEQAGLEFSLDVPLEGGDLTILGNEAQLGRALGGVLDNAIKFTPEGGSVELGVSSGEHRVSISVADSGIGIPEEELMHLTGRFHRGRNASNYPGNGLGLAILKAIVDNHGGRLSFESEVGQGTRVLLDLPKSKGEKPLGKKEVLSELTGTVANS